MIASTRRAALHDDVARRLRAGERGDDVARAFSDGVAALIAEATPASSPGVAVLAQGGLARRDLVPFADVDVLIVVEDHLARDADDGDDAGSGADHRGLTRPLYALWDEGFRVGHAVRSVGELPALFENLVAKDGHAATALLEARFIAGDAAFAQRVLRNVRRELLPGARNAIVDEKARELRVRRAKHGGSAFLQEPDLKNGVGGLRDLHALLWIGLLRAGEAARDPGGDLLAGLLAAGVLHPREAAALRVARAELLTFRAALHLAVGRGDDRLHAEAAAKTAAYLSDDGDDRDVRDGRDGNSGSGRPLTDDAVRAAEGVTRRAIRAMVSVKRNVDDALARLAPRAATAAAALAATTPPIVDEELLLDGPLAAPLGAGFVAVEGELHVDADAAVDLAAVVDAARIVYERDLIPSETLASRIAATVDGAAAAPDGAPADDRAAVALWRLAASTSIRPRRTSPDGPFTRLLEWGVLALVLPEMKRLETRVKLDGVHALTTDAHLARCADFALFLVGQPSTCPPALAPSLARTTATDVFVLSALFHDMGKGLDEDHSIAGARIVEREGSRMGLDADDVDSLTFLVEHHLDLSRTSQRRDLGDPAVIDEFCRAVRTPERLDLLALLTWVDMSAVAPGVGTEWKARLLGTAVDRARAALSSSAAQIVRDLEGEARARALRILAHAPAASRPAVDPYVAGATPRFLAGRTADDLAGDVDAFARVIGAAGEPAVATVHALGADVHVVRVVARDRAGLLADIAAAFAVEGVSVLDAALDVRSDGYAFDAFVVDDGRGRRLAGETVARLPAILIAAAVEAKATGTPTPRFGRRGGAGLHLGVRPRVRVLASDSWGRSVVEVRAADRVGLLADLARAFAESGFGIALARIHTEGPRVTDVFTLEPDRDHAAGLASLEKALLDVVSR